MTRVVPEALWSNYILTPSSHLIHSADRFFNMLHSTTSLPTRPSERFEKWVGTRFVQPSGAEGPSRRGVWGPSPGKVWKIGALSSHLRAFPGLREPLEIEAMIHWLSLVISAIKKESDDSQFSFSGQKQCPPTFWKCPPSAQKFLIFEGTGPPGHPRSDGLDCVLINLSYRWLLIFKTFFDIFSWISWTPPSKHRTH